MTIELKVPNMACSKGYRFAYGACGKTITKTVQEIDPEVRRLTPKYQYNRS